MPAAEGAELVRGWAGKTTGSSSSAECLGDSGERLGLRVRLPVEGEDEVAARLDARPLERVRALSGDRGEPEVGVVHDVAHLVDALRDPLGGQVRDRHVRGQKSRLEIRSTSIRFSSSGIARSKERRPASTWATGTSSLPAASAPASVEFVSPKTRTTSGRSSSTAASIPGSIRPVCSPCVPEPVSSR